MSSRLKPYPLLRRVLWVDRYRVLQSSVSNPFIVGDVDIWWKRRHRSSSFLCVSVLSPKKVVFSKTWRKRKGERRPVPTDCDINKDPVQLPTQVRETGGCYIIVKGCMVGVKTRSQEGTRRWGRGLGVQTDVTKERRGGGLCSFPIVEVFSFTN